MTQDIREEFNKEFAIWRKEPGTVDFESVDLLVNRLAKIAFFHHNTTLKEIEEEIGEDILDDGFAQDPSTAFNNGIDAERQRIKQLINQKLIK